VGDFSGRLSKAPLVYALCQVRFSPILKMGEQIPDIQEKLRTQYEEFVEEQVSTLQLAAQGETPSLRAETRWRLETSDRRSGFLLQNASVVYHTTGYLDFGTFVDEMFGGFAVIAALAGIRRFHRVGLRYIDLIQPEGDTEVHELLHPLLEGFGRELPGVTQQFSQYVFGGRTAVGQLVFRATCGTHDFPVPPDLLPLTLKLDRAPTAARPSVFLDTDHFVDSTDTPMEWEKLQDTVVALKEPIAQAFKLAITKKAVDAWK
jgi:uncharacterized protein (TIGR04255 family)